MGAVAVDAAGAVWWIEAGGRLHRRGAGVVAEGVQAVAVTPSGMMVLGTDGRLGSVDDIASARACDAIAGASDLAVDEVAAVVYAIVPGAVVARPLAGGDLRTVAELDATAVVLSPDRRRLCVADRGAGRVVAIAVARRDEIEVAVGGVAPGQDLGPGPTGISVTVAGVVATWPRAVVGINLRHGATTVIHGPAAALPLRAARGIAADRNRRMLWIADEHGLVAVATDGTGVVVEAAGA